MKKTISTWMLALVLATGAFVSCSKSGDKPSIPNPPDGGGSQNPPPTNTYVMKMKIDGVQQTFSSVTANLQQQDGGSVLVIDGFKDESQSEINELIVGAAGDIAAGEYTEGEHDSYGVAGVYKPANATEDQSYLAGVTLNPASPFKITITSITADAVKGTFSGSYFDNGGEGTNKKVITEGQFNVKIQK